jgi:hypothetical protein
MKSVAARLYGVLEYFRVHLAAVLATPIVVRVLHLTSHLFLQTPHYPLFESALTCCRMHIPLTRTCYRTVRHSEKRHLFFSVTASNTGSGFSLRFPQCRRTMTSRTSFSKASSPPT